MGRTLSVFAAIERRYQPKEGEPEVGAVVVEMEQETVVPAVECFERLGRPWQRNDGPVTAHAVRCITNAWKAWEVAHDWRDDWVYVDVDAGGRATFEQVFKEEPS